MKKYIAIVLPFFLSGCLLKQGDAGKTDSNVDKKATQAIAGIVTLQDIQGDVKNASLSAMFGIANQRASFTQVIQHLSDSRAASKLQCKVQVKRAPVVSEASVNAASSLISLGKIFIGPALQASYIEIPEDSNHKYYKKFDGAIPSNTYLLKVEGGTYSSAFAEPFSMPEEVVGLTPGKADVSVNNPLSLTFEKEYMKNSNTIDMIELNSATTDGDSTLLRCFALEKDFEESDQKIHITIDKSFVSQIPKNDKGVFMVSRVHIHNSDRADIEYQGIRTQGFQVKLKD